MLIKHFDAASAHAGHGGTILASDVLPSGLHPPFWHQYGELSRHGAMAGHAHETDEIYLVFSGSGYCILGGENRAVRAGDVIAIPRNVWHTMLCTDQDEEPFLWAALWWDALPGEAALKGFHIRRFVKSEASLAHNDTILASPVLPEGIHAPFGHAYGYVDAGGAIEAHAHPTEEIYIICEGSGVMAIDGETQAVRAGDVIAIPANATHSLAAVTEQPLLWAALWW